MRLSNRILYTLPLFFTLAAIPFYVLVINASRRTQSTSHLYFLKITLSTVHLTASLTSATGSIPNPALHVPVWYTVSLYTYCSGGSWSTGSLGPGSQEEKYPTYCSVPRARYWFNPATIPGLDTGHLAADEAYAASLQYFKKSGTALFVAHVLSIVACCVSALLYIVCLVLPLDWRPFSIPVSKIVGFAAKFLMLVQVISSVSTAVATRIVFQSMSKLIMDKMGHQGVQTQLGSKMLGMEAAAGLLSVLAATSWYALGCWWPRRSEVIYWPSKEFPNLLVEGGEVWRDVTGALEETKEELVRFMEDGEDEEGRLAVPGNDAWFGRKRASKTTVDEVPLLRRSGSGSGSSRERSKERHARSKSRNTRPKSTHATARLTAHTRELQIQDAHSVNTNIPDQEHKSTASIPAQGAGPAQTPQPAPLQVPEEELEPDQWGWEEDMWLHEGRG